MLAIRLALASLLLCLNASIFANTLVQELQPDELLAFVAKHPSAIVQLTSGDPRCGFCIGADKLFDELAAKSPAKPLVFARVQWSLWKDFPTFDPAIRVFGVPSMLFFKNGKQTDLIEGRFKEPADIADIVDMITLFSSFTPAPSEPGRLLGSSHVAELRPDQLMGYLAANPWAVVQFISSDLNCGYCQGAAFSFNNAAKFRVDKSVPFARVQWPSPWRAIPQYPGQFVIDGIPGVKVFHRGKVVTEVSGKPQDRNDVFRVMNAAFEKVRTGVAP